MVFSEVIAQNKLGVITVAKEVTLSDWLDFVVVKLESVFVSELDHTVLQVANRFKKLI